MLFYINMLQKEESFRTGRQVKRDRTERHANGLTHQLL
jgi:hypothetical protein